MSRENDRILKTRNDCPVPFKAVFSPLDCEKGACRWEENGNCIFIGMTVRQAKNLIKLFGQTVRAEARVLSAVDKYKCTNEALEATKQVYVEMVKGSADPEATTA